MTTPLSNAATGRTPEAEILPLLLERWSPRSFTDEALPPELQERQRPSVRHPVGTRAFHGNFQEPTPG